MTTLEKAVALTKMAQEELVQHGKINMEIFAKEHALLKEAKKMKPLHAKQLTESEFVGAFYLVCMLSDHNGENMVNQVIDDEDKLWQTLVDRNTEYLENVAYSLGENRDSVAGFYEVLRRDKSVV